MESKLVRKSNKFTLEHHKIFISLSTEVFVEFIVSLLQTNGNPGIEKPRFPGASSNSWWPKAELNRRHTDFQSVALPAELPGHKRLGGPYGIRTRGLFRDREAC